MKRIQIIIYTLFGLLLIALLGNSIMSISALFFENDILNLGSFKSEDVPSYLKGISILKLIVIVLFCTGVFHLIKVLNLFTKGFYFSDRLVFLFKSSGMYFIISGTLGFLSSLTPFIIRGSNYVMYLNFDSKSLYFILIIIGLFFIAFSKIVKEGNFIKQENDLTI